MATAIGFPSRKSYNRMRRAVRAVESDRKTIGRRDRPSFPGGGGGGVRLAKTNEEIEVDDSGSVELYKWDEDTQDWIEAGKSVTARNKFATIETDKFVAISKVNGQWLILGGQC